MSDLLDNEGYPTGKALDAIAKWSPPSTYKDLMAFVMQLWTYDDYWKQSITTDAFTGNEVMSYYISTGGWSGNESIIAALQDNILFWALCWTQSRRGGHYIFDIDVKEK